MFNNNSNGPLFWLLLVCAWSVEAATTAAKKTAPPTPWWQVAAAGGAYFALYAIPITIFLVGATHFKRMWTHIHMHHEQRQNPIDMSAFRHWTTYPYAKHAQHALTTLMDHLRDTSFTYAPRLVPGPGAEVHSVLWTDVEFVQGPKKNYTRNTFGAIIMIVLFCLAPTLGLVVGLRIVFLAYTFFIAWNIPGIVTMIYLLSTCRKDLRAGFNRQIVKNIFVVTSLGACTLDVEDPTVLKNVIDFEDVCAGSAEVCELYVAPAEPVPAPAPAAANPAPAAAPADPNAAPAAADPNAPAADPNAAADANAAPAADANAAPAADANAAPAAVQDAPAVVTIPADPTKLTSVRVRKTDGSYVYVCHDVMYAKECVDAINIALTLRDRSRLVTVDLVLDSLQQQTVQLPALAVERIMSFLPALDEMWTRKKNELRAHGGKTEITNAQGEIVWRFDTHVEEAIPYTPSLPNYSAAAAAAVESPEYARASSSINEKGRRDEDITYIVPEMDYTTMMSPVPASPALVTLMPHLDAMMHSPDIRFRSSPALRRGITNRD